MINTRGARGWGEHHREPGRDGQRDEPAGDGDAAAGRGQVEHEDAVGVQGERVRERRGQEDDRHDVSGWGRRLLSNASF